MGYVLANIIQLLCQYVFCCVIEVSGVKPFLNPYHVSIINNIYVVSVRAKCGAAGFPP